MREKKSVPFQKDQVIEFFKGSVVTDDKDLSFEYSLSTKAYLGKFRMTLSFDEGEIKKVCVFQIDPPHEVIPENETSKAIWGNLTHPHFQNLEKAVYLIVRHHLTFV